MEWADGQSVAATAETALKWAWNERQGQAQRPASRYPPEPEARVAPSPSWPVASGLLRCPGT